MYDFLKSNPVGVLSTVTKNGDPHGVAIYFSVDEHLTLAFLTRRGTRKYANIAHHNVVMLTVFCRQTQTTLQVSGRASEVRDELQLNRIAAATLGSALATSHNGLPPITKLQAGEYAAFTIKPTQICMAMYERPEPGKYADLFESVESFELDA
jgi:uncharacterized pyridoxamine 5'-phosphate oxidase family protein